MGVTPLEQKCCRSPFHPEKALVAVFLAVVFVCTLMKQHKKKERFFPLVMRIIHHHPRRAVLVLRVLVESTGCTESTLGHFTGTEVYNYD